MRARFLSLFAGLLIAGCGGGEETEPPDAPGQPAGWDDELRLPIAEDRDADADVVEIDLTAREAGLQVRPGVTTQVRTYDGGLPGPLIRAKRGDRLRAHFHNDLPDPTTIHWHGLRCRSRWTGRPTCRSRRWGAGGVRLRLRPAGRGALLVPPARRLGRPGGERALRRDSGG
ncbi:MAG: multicopper oxidase domain-containing protein [Polyangiaceae bacterium]